MAPRSRRAPRLKSIRLVPIDYPDRVMAEYYLADLFLNRGDIEEAAPIFERVLAAQRRLYGDNSRATADTLASLAQVRIAQKNFGAAEKLIREALEAHRESSSTAYLQIGYLQTMLAMVQMTTRAVRRCRADSSRYARSLQQEHTRRSPVHRLRGALPGRGPARAAQVPRSGGRAARGDGTLEAHGRACLAFRAVSERTRRSAAWTRTNRRS